MTTSWKVKNKERARFWRSHIDQWSVSKLTQTEYCRKNDLSRTRFTYWKVKFKKQNLPVGFVQISEPMLHAPAELKLNIGREFQIEIPDGFSQAALEQVLMALKVVSC